MSKPIRVFVYRNLHRNCWSVRALSGPEKGRVIAHRKVLTLRDATFKVSEAGRQRVLRERRKNVHAGVVGYLSRGSMNDDGVTRLRYDPYERSYFYTVPQLNQVLHAGKVYLSGSGWVWADTDLLTVRRR